MSRVYLKAKDPQNSICVGLDHTLGYFIQVEGPPDKDGEDNFLVDMDQCFAPGFGRGKLIEIMDEFADQNDPKFKLVRDNVILDWDPAKDLKEK